jgi:hypothetical protein
MDRLPAAAVKKAAAVYRRRLEEDTALGRENLAGEVLSVLTFCRFVESGGKSGLLHFPYVPLEHMAAYAKIVQRLVAAQELSLHEEDQLKGKPGGTLTNATG